MDPRLRKRNQKKLYESNTVHAGRDCRLCVSRVGEALMRVTTDFTEDALV
jgi:hypothetical protein